jgi:hypothetical protein
MNRDQLFKIWTGARLSQDTGATRSVSEGRALADSRGPTQRSSSKLPSGSRGERRASQLESEAGHS